MFKLYYTMVVLYKHIKYISDLVHTFRILVVLNLYKENSLELG